MTQKINPQKNQANDCKHDWHEKQKVVYGGMSGAVISETFVQVCSKCGAEKDEETKYATMNDGF